MGKCLRAVKKRKRRKRWVERKKELVRKLMKK